MREKAGVGFNISTDALGCPRPAGCSGRALCTVQGSPEWWQRPAVMCIGGDVGGRSCHHGHKRPISFFDPCQRRCAPHARGNRLDRRCAGTPLASPAIHRTRGDMLASSLGVRTHNGIN